MKRIYSIILVLAMLLSLVPLTAAAKGDKLIAVTFDDGPSANTYALLDGLKARGVKATFFMQGCNAERYPDIVRRVWAEGHQLCSHTYDHKSLTSLNKNGILDEVSKTDAILDSALGWDLSYILRPPYGNYNRTVLDTVGVPCIYWSVDTRDWESRNADAVYKQFVSAARDGSVVLLHDLYKTTVEGALRAIDKLQADGYEFVTISELFYRRGIALEKGSIYFSAYPKSYGTDPGIAEPAISVSNRGADRLVSISGDARGAVYYTTDGSDPTPLNSTKYTGEFAVSSGCTVKAVSALDWNGLRSDVTAKLVKDVPAAAPGINIGIGKVSMSCQTPGGSIYYTTDGSDPTQDSTLYTGQFPSMRGTTYKARCYAEGFAPSEVSTLTYTERGNLFEDIYIGQWCCDAVDQAVSDGLFRGVSERRFEPQSFITRAQLVTVLWRANGKPVAEAQPQFSDITAGHWAYDAIAWGSENGVIMGYQDGSFRPTAPVTRAQFVTMLHRSVGTPEAETALDGFTDAAEVGEFSRAALEWAVENGIVSGYADGALRPNDPCTRAAAAAILTRFFKAF